MTDNRKNKGKQSLPFLLSTTKSLIKAKRYYYRYIDFQFNCKRNRDCYSERNVRINMTRMWHNIIIPNAILCRESGFIPTLQDALDALNHAMTHGKTPRSLAMWRQICQDEAKLPDEQKVVYKFRNSFFFYVLGKGRRKDGTIYCVPKAKVMSVEDYVKKEIINYIDQKSIRRFCWLCPWDDLNRLVYIWQHWDDNFDKTQDKLDDAMKRLLNHSKWSYRSPNKNEEAALEKLDAINMKLIKPEFPQKLRDIANEFHVSLTSAKRFNDWLKQLEKYNPDSDIATLRWASPKGVTQIKQYEDIIDLSELKKNAKLTEDDLVDGGDNIASIIDSLVKSGERPDGEDKDPLQDLPWDGISPF